MKTQLCQLLSFLAACILFSNCSKKLLTYGIYKNDYSILRLNNDNTFDYYYRKPFSEIFSSGTYDYSQKLIFLKSDLGNLPVIDNITANNNTHLGNDDKEFIIQNFAFEAEDTNYIKYLLIINDTLKVQINKNRFEISGLKYISKLKIEITRNVADDYISTVNNSLITPSRYILDSTKNSFHLSLKMNFKMFNVVIFNDTIVVKKRALEWNEKGSFYKCSKCKWEDEKMNSPIMIYK